MLRIQFQLLLCSVLLALISTQAAVIPIDRLLSVSPADTTARVFLAHPGRENPSHKESTPTRRDAKILKTKAKGRILLDKILSASPADTTAKVFLAHPGRQNPNRLSRRNDTDGTDEKGRVVNQHKFLQAAAAKVTPGYNKSGHRARRDGNGSSNFPTVGKLVTSSTQKASTTTKATSTSTAQKVTSTSTAKSSTSTAKSSTSTAKSSTSTAKSSTSTAKSSTSTAKSSSTTPAKVTTQPVAAAVAATTAPTAGVTTTKAKQCKKKTKTTSVLTSTAKSTATTTTGQAKATTSTAAKITTSTAAKTTTASTSQAKTTTTTASSTQTKNTSTASKTTATTTTADAKATTTTTAQPTTATDAPTGTTTTASPTQTTDSSYGTTEAMSDLETIMSWAGATDAMTSSEKNETVSALLSAAQRYFPELPTNHTVRYLLADINAESSFDPKAWNGGRLDSGASLGLMQVSPSAGAQILPLWQGHARVSANTFSWTSTPGPAGVLLDDETGTQLVLSSLTADDLYRPWINIHIGAWVQSNLGRTAGCDPYYWEAISSAAAAARAAETENDTSKSDSSYSAMVSAQSKETSSLVCASSKVSRSVLTGLGSWVAGATTNGDDSYTGSGDDVSAPYFKNIANGLKVLTGNSTLDSSWLNALTLTAGVVDYRQSS